MIVGNKGATGPILFRGVGLVSDKDNHLTLDILHAATTAYSFNPDSPVQEVIALFSACYNRFKWAHKLLFLGHSLTSGVNDESTLLIVFHNISEIISFSSRYVLIMNISVSERSRKGSVAGGSAAGAKQRPRRHHRFSRHVLRRLHQRSSSQSRIQRQVSNYGLFTVRMVNESRVHIRLLAS